MKKKRIVFMVSRICILIGVMLRGVDGFSHVIADIYLESTVSKVAIVALADDKPRW